MNRKIEEISVSSLIPFEGNLRMNANGTKNCEQHTVSCKTFYQHNALCQIRRISAYV